MQHFYDGQIRRYLTQMVRMMSGFTYQDGNKQLTAVPVLYGDITRQVGSILRDNSENKIPSAPRMGVYVTGIEMDRDRTSDSSYINKVHIRERAYNSAGQEYLNTEGKNYTVERLMPTPYTLTMNVDIWTTNTDQKLQLMEQILMLFNPSLELQTTDNYLDWASLTVVNLDSVTWSSRSIPTGTESDIDVATLTFTTPIFISPPAKVKRLGVVTEIFNKVFQGVITDELDNADIRTKIYVSPTGELQRNKTEWKQSLNTLNIVSTAYQNTELYVKDNEAILIKRGVLGGVTWPEFIKGFPSAFESGVTSIRLLRNDWNYDIIGRVSVNPLDETKLSINWDDDTLPSDTVIPSSLGNRSKIDYIIDPTKSDPRTLGLSGNPRILLLGDIGNVNNEDGADAWKNTNGSDFIASENDIVEWDGANWSTVFDADVDTSIYGTVYTTNLNTGVQYKFDSGEWILSFEGEYPNGSWKLDF
tara:strand:+ start:2229 stop:3650 length:1422 start_codon:yes stop_codon:yes gene_type:complete